VVAAGEGDLDRIEPRASGGGGIVGVGTDLVEIDRFREAAGRTPGILTRYFTEGERAYAERRNDPTERYAARFAAKEAVMKALGVGLGACELAEIEVVRDEDSGAPDLVLHGKAAALAAERGVTAWHLSLTHTDTAAHAIAIAT
jgi:holo-[acyl-carrier protein] synthase